MNEFVIISTLNRGASREMLSLVFDVIAKGQTTLNITLCSVKDSDLNETLFICKFLSYLKDISIIVHTHAEGIMDESALMLYLTGSVRSMDSGSEFRLNSEIGSFDKFYREGVHTELDAITTNNGNAISLRSLLINHNKITAHAALGIGISDIITNY